MRRHNKFLLALLVVLLSLALTDGNGRAADNAIRVGMIPDAGATQVSVDQKKPLKDYLAAALGQPVELIIPTNYNATVEGLGNRSLDFAYLGGLTYLKAHEQYGATPLVQRQSDQQFHSLFITQAGSSIKSLADLKGKTFAFGDIVSTSGHLMPFLAMTNAGVNVDTDLKFRYSGSHAATAKAVEAGAVDAARSTKRSSAR
jgi:phosphonate transport system substrate-binding protein